MTDLARAILVKDLYRLPRVDTDVIVISSGCVETGAALRFVVLQLR